MALTGVAQSAGWASSLKVKGHWFNCQGTCLGEGSVPSQGPHKKQPIDVSLSHWCFSSSLSPSFPISLKVNKISKKNLYTFVFSLSRSHWRWIADFVFKYIYIYIYIYNVYFLVLMLGYIYIKQIYIYIYIYIYICS